MIEILEWIIVIVGYSFCFVVLAYVFAFAISLRREVPFVRSNDKALREAIKFLNITPKDTFVDIGSGDGRVVLLASQISEGKSYIGIEMDGFLVLVSNLKKIFSIKRRIISFVKLDGMEYNYGNCTKVYLYLTTRVSALFIKKLEKDLPRGAEVVSCEFGFGEDFEKKNKIEIKTLEIGKKQIRLFKWKKK